MRNIVIILFFLVCGAVSAQQYFFNGTVHVPKTTAQINAIVSPQEGRQEANSDTGTMFYYNGSDWINTGVPLVDASGFSGNLDSGITDLQLLAEAVDSLTIGGGSSSDLDLTGNVLSLTDPTTPGNEVDLSTVPIIASALQSGDDVSELTNDAGYLTSAAVGGIVAEGVYSIVGGSETYTISHDLGYTPSQTRIQTQQLSTNTDNKMLVENITTTTFDLAVGSAIVAGNIAWRIFGSDNATPMTGSEIVTSIDTELGSTTWQGGGSSAPFPDNEPIIADNADPTKTVTIVASGITTGTNRNLTMPDAPVNLGAISDGDKGDILVSGTALTIDVGAVDNSNIANGVDATRINTGDVSNTEFNYLNGVTSDIQTQLNSKVATTIAGRTGDAVEAVMIQDEADYISDGDPGTNEVVFCRGCAPMQVGTSATIDIDKYRGYDDRAIDAGTFTFDNLKTGAAVLIEINRASDATYSGVTFAYTTGAFEANTRQLVTIFILPSGDALRDYKTIE